MGGKGLGETPPGASWVVRHIPFFFCLFLNTGPGWRVRSGFSEGEVHFVHNKTNAEKSTVHPYVYSFRL